MRFLLSIIWLLTVLPAIAQVDQDARWLSARINPIDSIRLDKAVLRYQLNEARYKGIERMRENGVPAPVIFCFHSRESDNDFTRHLHEGSPLTGRTVDVPKGRPLTPDPPYTFEQSAEDALYILKHLERVNWLNRPEALQRMEAYNGLGYQKYHPAVPSPYLWAGTNLYTRGKYVADGRFNSLAMDKQLGCAAILIRMAERGVEVPFQ